MAIVGIETNCMTIQVATRLAQATTELNSQNKGAERMALGVHTSPCSWVAAISVSLINGMPVSLNNDITVYDLGALYCHKGKK